MTTPISPVATSTIPFYSGPDTNLVAMPYRYGDGSETAQEHPSIRVDNTRNFFTDLSATKARLGPTNELNLTALQTEVKGGKLYLQFLDGGSMALDAVVAELKARGILKPPFVKNGVLDVKTLPSVVVRLHDRDLHNQALIDGINATVDKYQVLIQAEMAPAGAPTEPSPGPSNPAPEGSVILT